MLSNLDDEKTSRAAEFITDWSRLSWRCRNPDVKVLKDITSDRRTDRDTDTSELAQHGKAGGPSTLDPVFVTCKLQPSFCISV